MSPTYQAGRQGKCVVKVSPSDSRLATMIVVARSFRLVIEYAIFGS